MTREDEIFRAKIKERLPQNIVINKVRYIASGGMLMSGSYEIEYIAFYEDRHKLVHITIFHTIEDESRICFKKTEDFLKTVEYVQVEKHYNAYEQFHRDMGELLKKYNCAEGTHTTNEKLASFVIGCIESSKSL